MPTSIVGETLTLLWSDLDNDGWVDLIETNDFAPPDVFYMNNKGVYDHPVSNTEKKFETSTKTTMSVISADLDNDLSPEIYIGEIALMGLASDEFLEVDKDAIQICAELASETDRQACLNYLKLLTMDRAMKWQRKAQEIESRSNMEFLVFLNNMRRNNLTCDDIPKEWSFLKRHCERVFNSDYNTPEKADIKEAIPSPGLGENVLLVNDGNNRYQNKASDWGIATGGYTWNAKFADLNADEYQDLYIVNGSHVHRTRQSNFFYINEGGNRFQNQISEYEALNSFLATQTYTYTDIDNDGDQDIITLPVIGPAQAHFNEMKKGNVIAFELRDQMGNRYGIGSKITIHYGDSSDRHQVRELLASGGHLSYDPYIAYFGLGNYKEVKKVTIQWSTGEETQMTGPFHSGARYEVRRSDELLN
ncbi:MAG: CRTAC1 family protein [Cytophagales bacterium]|nr:CRTAC1 family protein [Cytophagales bacterium]